MGKHNFHENMTEFGEIKVSSNRSFGLTFAAVFLVLGSLPLYHQHSPHYLLVAASALMLLLSFFGASLLTYPNRVWSKFGLMLGKIMTPIILGLMFFVVLTPFAVMLRCFGKDLLSLRLRLNQQSYWIERTPPGPKPESLHQQF